MGDRYVNLKASLSDVIGALYAKTTDGIQGAKDAITNLNSKLMALVASAYGEVVNKFQMLSSRVHEGYLYVAAKVNERTVVLRLKVSEAIEAVRSKSSEMYSITLEALTSTYSGAKTSVFNATKRSRTKAIEIIATTKAKVSHASEVTKGKAIETGNIVCTFAADPKAKVTVVSAAGGAVALGASGGAAGFAAGGAAGAACGVPFALFTFGMSIPAGAAIGAVSGLCVGTVTGGAAGIAAGGAAGYGANKHKTEIGNGFAGAINKAKAYKDSAKARAMQVCGHTGGTAFAAQEDVRLLDEKVVFASEAEFKERAALEFKERAAAEAKLQEQARAQEKENKLQEEAEAQKPDLKNQTWKKMPEARKLGKNVKAKKTEAESH